MAFDAQGKVMELLIRGGDHYVDRGAQGYVLREAGKAGHYLGTGDPHERYLALRLREEDHGLGTRNSSKDISDSVMGSYDHRQNWGRLGQLANSGIDVSSALYLLSGQAERSSCYRC